MSLFLSKPLSPLNQSARFLEGSIVSTAFDIANRARELAADFQGRRHAWMVRSSQASDVFGALLLCESLQLPLVICHTHLPTEQVREIQESQRVGAVIHPHMQIERLPETTDQKGQESVFSILLMTSGTTGKPKIARHSPLHLLGRMRLVKSDPPAKWLLTYPPTTFAGVQVLLTAVLSGSELICPQNYDIFSLAQSAEELNVSHISGTPTFWRSLLVALGATSKLPALRHVTLGGEISDQATLNRIRQRFPSARIAHIYASTEAGSLFSVHDGKAGFPSAWLEEGVDGTALSVRDDVLWVRSPRRMLEYASDHEALMSQGGWLCTGDRVKIDENRVYFVGRSDQIVNIGGSKVSPADVEAVILQVEGVSDVIVRAVRNPITGFVLAADIVADRGVDQNVLRRLIVSHCRRSLSDFQIPRMIRFLSASMQSYSGKKLTGEKT